MWEEAEAIGLGVDILEGYNEEEEEEAETGGDAIPLERFQLGVAIVSEEYSAKLARARFQGTFHLLFTPECIKSADS